VINRKHITVGLLGWVVCFSIGVMPVAAEPTSDKQEAAVSMKLDLNSMELAALGEQSPFMEFERPAPSRADRAIWNEIRVQGDQRGVSVAVSHEFSTWSDLTSVFRPSRWKNPVRPGGPLSFLNLECWISEPGRTAKTFVGTAVVVGGIAAVASGSGGGGDDTAKEVAVISPATTTSSRPSASSQPGATEVENTPVETSVSGGSPVAAPPAPEPPAPEPPSGGFVEET
jgi:hypothetical protein